MFGAIDAGLILDAARLKKEREAKRNSELISTPEGRMKLAYEIASDAAYDMIPPGAPAYRLTKLGRLPEPENPNPPMIYNGESGSGYIRVLTQEFVNHMENEDPEKGEFMGIQWETQSELKPRIGSVVIAEGYGRWIRTSVVRSYYVHEDPNGYAEHPDKLVLPGNFPIETLVKMTPDDWKFEPGDVVMCTMNSMYLARKIKGSEYKYEELKEE